MERERIEKALARIEAAAARIEAASARTPSNGNPELARKHSKLRTDVTGVLQEMDALIGRLNDQPGTMSPEQ